MKNKIEINKLDINFYWMNNEIYINSTINSYESYSLNIKKLFRKNLVNLDKFIKKSIKKFIGIKNYFLSKKIIIKHININLDNFFFQELKTFSITNIKLLTNTKIKLKFLDLNINNYVFENHFILFLNNNKLNNININIKKEYFNSFYTFNFNILTIQRFYINANYNNINIDKILNKTSINEIVLKKLKEINLDVIKKERLNNQTHSLVLKNIKKIIVSKTLEYKDLILIENSLIDNNKLNIINSFELILRNINIDKININNNFTFNKIKLYNSNVNNININIKESNTVYKCYELILDNSKITNITPYEFEVIIIKSIQNLDKYRNILDNNNCVILLIDELIENNNSIQYLINELSVIINNFEYLLKRKLYKIRIENKLSYNNKYYKFITELKYFINKKINNYLKNYNEETYNSDKINQIKEIFYLNIKKILIKYNINVDNNIFRTDKIDTTIKINSI